VRDLAWSRPEQIAGLSESIWRFVSPGLEISSDALPLIAALSGLASRDRSYLASMHLVMSSEAGELLDAGPGLLRSLTTSTTAPLDVHPERIRGPVDWAMTLALMGQTGRRVQYATRPIERDFETPENRMLFASLRALSEAAAALQWDAASTGVGLLVSTRRSRAARLLSSPITRNVIGKPEPGDLRRVERGRASRRFDSVVRFWRLHRELNVIENQQVLRDLIERTALAPANDGLLMELLTFFGVLRALEAFGWTSADIGLVRGGVRVQLLRGADTLTVGYQQAPKVSSRYGEILAAHSMPSSSLRPDVWLDHRPYQGQRSLKIVEVKYRPLLAHGIRDALFDCLGYMQTYVESVIPVSALGIAWGADLVPVSRHGVSLCTLDHLPDALDSFQATQT
jgi:hypothetical protein